MTKLQELDQMHDIAMLTAVGYITLQRQGAKPTDNINNSKASTLIDLTQGQVISFLFGDGIDVSRAKASEALKHEFNVRVKPHIPRIANEAIYQDEGLGRLSLTTLEQKASYLQKTYGNEWDKTDEGINIAYVLDIVYGHVYTKAMPFFKYKTIVFTAHEIYKKEVSKVDWDTIFDINNYIA